MHTDKKALNETEICQAFITPAIAKAGWDKLTQIRREHTFTDGQVIVRGKLAVPRQAQARGLRPLLSVNLPSRRRIRPPWRPVTSASPWTPTRLTR